MKWRRAPGKTMPIVALVGGICIGLFVCFNFFGTEEAERPATESAIKTIETFDAYAGSSSCRECHAEQFEDWKTSHHGLAERNISAERDAEALQRRRFCGLEFRDVRDRPETEIRGHLPGRLRHGLHDYQHQFCPRREVAGYGAR